MASDEPTEPVSLRLDVDSTAAGERIDRYLARSLPELSRAQAQALIAASRVLVDDQPCRASYIVRPGDQITLSIPPPQVSTLQPEPIPLDVVYEDAALAVINKPAGMVVHPAPGHSGGTLANALLARYPDISVGGALRPGIVHRLDQDTSGLIVVARTDQAMHSLTEQQRERSMRKIYLAVVEGHMRQDHGVIDVPIGRHPGDRLRMAVVADGRPSRTHYRVLEALGAYTLLEVQLETGRTHQIRVHMRHINRPVLGDPLYGPRSRSRYGLARQFLHAQQLGFRHPDDDRPMIFHAPLPADLEMALARLRRATPS